jgi:hypothetical protein
MRRQTENFVLAVFGKLRPGLSMMVYRLLVIIRFSVHIVSNIENKYNRP